MTGPAVYGGSPPPLPNEIIALVMTLATLSGGIYLFWRIQREGMMAFRRSPLFLVALNVAAAAYYAVYTGLGTP